MPATTAVKSPARKPAVKAKPKAPVVKISAAQQAKLDAAAKVLRKAKGGSMHNRDIARAIGIDKDPGFSRLYAAMKASPVFVFAPQKRRAHFGLK